MAGEILAETCRYYYLDVILKGKSQPIIKTGCEPIDNLIQTMCEQAKLTLTKSKSAIHCDGIEAQGLDLLM